MLRYRYLASKCPHRRDAHTFGPRPAVDPYTRAVTYVFNSLLGRLVGYRLYSIEFVLDYVQLHFDVFPPADTPVLTCDVNPIVIMSDRMVAPDQPGWADALVALAGQSITAAHEGAGAGLSIELETGTIRLRPSADELVGPEIATLNAFADGRWMCWRPAEEAFEYLRVGAQGAPPSDQQLFGDTQGSTSGPS